MWPSNHFWMVYQFIAHPYPTLLNHLLHEAIRRFGLQYHQCANKTQLYLSFPFYPQIPGNLLKS